MRKFTPTELTLPEKQALVSITYHEGWKVLKKLMERRVQNATVRMLDIAPDDPKRAELLNSLQADAFAKDSFCQELLEEMNWHLQTLEAVEDEPESPGIREMMESAKRIGILKEA
jgi:hypothetical protein